MGRALEPLDELENICYSGRMASSTVLVRAKLTAREWARIRKLAIDRGVPVSQMAGDALRVLLERGKP